MQRLIMEFGVGDGYTYSAEVTYPIVYESKEKAMHDFELLLIEKVEIVSVLQEQREELSLHTSSLYEKIKNISSDKRTLMKDKEKNIQLIQSEMLEFRKDKVLPLEEKINEAQTVVFGGQSFHLENFVYRRESDNQHDYILPEISTLDEYFSKVELKSNPTKKLGM